MPIGRIIRVVSSGLVYIADDNSEQHVFTLDKLVGYRGEYPKQLKRFGRRGLRAGCEVFFQTNQDNRVIKVRPATDQDRIDLKLGLMNEEDSIRHAQAIAEGFSDKVCPECKTVLLAFHHFVRCNSRTCPMNSRDAAGQAQPSLLERLFPPR